MYLATFGICLVKYMNSTLLSFLLHQDKQSKEPYKKTKLKLDLLIDINMLLMIEKV